MTTGRTDRGGGGEGAGGGGRLAHLLAAAALLGIAVGVVVDTARYPGSLQPGAPGPAFFPRLLAAALGALALVLAGRALAGATSVGDLPDRAGLGRVAVAVALVAAFVASLHAGDLFVALPLLLGAIMALMGERRIPVIVAVPLLFDLFVYVVFYRFFSVDLPTVLF